MYVNYAQIAFKQFELAAVISQGNQGIMFNFLSKDNELEVNFL